MRVKGRRCKAGDDDPGVLCKGCIRQISDRTQVLKIGKAHGNTTKLRFYVSRAVMLLTAHVCNLFAKRCMGNESACTYL
jgi:hypothetical protein